MAQRSNWYAAIQCIFRFQKRPRTSSHPLFAQGSFVIASPTCSSEALVLYADALYGKGEFKRAKGYYRQALVGRKTGRCTVGIKSFKKDGYTTAASEAEIKYKIALCQLKLKENADALATLESVPGRNRTLAVNLTMGQLYQQSGVRLFSCHLR